LLKGDPKTAIELVVNREGKGNLTFKLIREKIKVSNVVVQEKIGDAGYIKIDDFTPGAAKEVEEAIKNLKKQGAKGIILDLRENLGGLLFEAVNMVNLFVPKGLEVVSTKGKADDWNKTYRTLSQPYDTKIPLVVLVSGSSASASEIVAGALQDYDRALLVGDKTFGKGLVQQTVNLPYKSKLKVTTAKYYIPSGRCIQSLDYTNRKADGTVSRKADSLKVAFKTKAGRLVYDGGGLDPDYKIGYTGIPVLENLLANEFLFEYANVYCGKNNKPTDLKVFNLTDVDYQDFLIWLSKNQFNYSTALEEQVKELENESGETREAEVAAAIKNLKDKILAAKAQDLIRYKTQITEALAAEIGFHYGLYTGRFQVSVGADKEIRYAMSVLADSKLYQSFFRPQ
jgi:carboxyl-terminal processing protease